MFSLSSWQLFAFGSAFFAALTAIFGKLGVSDINSDLATWIRTIVIFLVVSGILSLRREWGLTEGITRHALLFLTLSGVATGLSWLCYYRALKLGPVSRVAPVDKLSVVLVIVFAFLFLGEKLSWKVGIGALLIAAGSVLIALA
jgi:transporter family protein